MAHYLVRARIKREGLAELRSRLDRQELLRLRPFGESLTRGLQGARWDAEAGEALWEEEDYCSPPLAMEREAVLDTYFESIRTEAVQPGEGWQRIAHLPSLWEAVVGDQEKL